MRRLTRIALMLLCTVCLPLVQANPILEGFFNELCFPSGSWVLEMHAHPLNLGGWSLSSRSGSAMFRPGIVLNMNYVLIAPDSLLTPLAIDSLGDSLTLSSPSGMMAELVFGNAWNSAVVAPVSGQSICLHQTESFYYLDNSPTLGAPNDALNATATLAGVVEDSSTRMPLSGVKVLGQGDSATTNGYGQFTLHEYARALHVHFMHPNYETKSIAVVLPPEQTQVMQIVMKSITSVPLSERPQGVRVSQNYPNPFNPSTTIAYHLPVAARVTLTVYSASGEKIAELHRGVQAPGDHLAGWNGTNEDDRAIASGIYLARFEATSLPHGTNFVAALKLLLLR